MKATLARFWVLLAMGGGLAASPAPSLAAGLTLGPDAQQHLGLATQRLAFGRRAGEIDAYAKVLDPGPLAQLISDLMTAETASVASKAEAARAKALNASGGGVSAKDAEAAVAQAQAAQAEPALHKQIGQLNDLLAVYLGRAPGEAQAVRLDLADLKLPTDLPVSLPSELVRQRPDVQVAEANLHAASAQVGVAAALAVCCRVSAS